MTINGTVIPVIGLHPVLLEQQYVNMLIVGGDRHALLQLQSLKKPASFRSIMVIAPEISSAVKDFAGSYPNIHLQEKIFDPSDLEHKNLVVVATENQLLENKVSLLAIERNILLNKWENISSTITPVEPSVQDEVISAPDKLDATLVSKRTTLKNTADPDLRKWPKIVKFCLFAFFFMILGHAVLSYIPLEKIWGSIRSVPVQIDTKTFFIMLFTGFIAQMADGSLGMGYGTISTTFLLATGVNPAIVSSRVHSARVFSSGVSGYSHHRFGNINKKLFKALVIPGVIGAIVGATLAFFGQAYSNWVRLPLSVYTCYLGYFIIRKAFKKKNNKDKVTRAGWLASVGGFMDAFAGGGWGALVTSTLLSKRRNPSYVIGSVCLAEFFVVLVSSVTFFILLKSIPIVDVAGLIIGGVIAAPIAARLVGKLPLKTMFVIVGVFVILTSLNTLVKSILVTLH